MNIKTIALVMFDSAEAEWLIEKTAALAARLRAHVLGLHPYTPAVFFSGIAVEPVIFPTFADWKKDESDLIRKMFDKVARNNDLQSEFRNQNLLYGTEDFLLASARSADLVIIGTNASSSRSPDNRAIAAELIRHVGRPVLVLPQEAEMTEPAKRIVIGWSDTREATRAAHDALDLAKYEASVHIVSLVAHPGDVGMPWESHDDFAAALDRRGFRATTVERMSKTENRAEELLRIAKEQEADLLVTGAYGHSQVYDFVIGAVTGHLLENAKLPLLLSK